MSARERKEGASGPEEARRDPLANENEGEGSTSGTKKYDEELEEFKKTHDPEKLAEEAERDLEADTGEIAEAERIGRSKKQEPD
jgi:hypothetical protein